MNFSGFDDISALTQTDDPIRLFDEAPKPPGINDLYKSQAEVLEVWYKGKRRDTVVKMHTGGGKTLVGLLMAKSMLISAQRPVLYLCPNNQLVDQTLGKAAEYSIDVVGYPSRGFPAAFENAEAIMVAPYEALFNGESRFGTTDGRKPVFDLGGLIIDDAHAAFADLRDAFTYTISANDVELFRDIANLFRNDISAVGKRGTFDDILSGTANAIIEVPYWAWREKEDRVRAYISAKKAKDDQGKLVDKERFFKWPFLRDQLAVCHALISGRGFTITPILPLVDEVPSYAECPRRIFMSATVNDDSALIRTFKLEKNYLTASARGATGIAERFVLAPAFTPNFELTYEAATKAVAKHVANDRDRGVVVLAPSAQKAKPWSESGRIVKGNDDVVTALRELKSGKTRGPVVFLNRYDGLDLPENSCRLVVLWESPTGTADYDQYRAAMLHGGDEIAASVARTIEQGMGRGARGASDYCIVLFAGRTLESWIAKKSNLRHFSLATQVQVEIGRSVSTTITSLDALKAAIDTVLYRDKRWTTRHASHLSAELERASLVSVDVTPALDERAAFDEMRRGHFSDARREYEQLASKTSDARLTAWYLQIAARCALYDNDEANAERLQGDSHAANDRFPRPLKNRRYIPVTAPTDQSRAIASRIEEYDPPSAVLLSFDEDLANLSAQASAHQFEESLSELGRYLGFTAQRPEKTDKIGPDVLWLAPGHAFVLEAKSRKYEDSRVAKKDVGQLLTAANWFESRYPGIPFTHAIVAPTPTSENNFEPGTCQALSMAKLQELVGELRRLYAELSERSSTTSLSQQAAGALQISPFLPKRLLGYFTPLFGEQPRKSSL